MFHFFRSENSGAALAEDSSLSKFVRKASSEEKKKIYKRVITQATEDQRKVIKQAELKRSDRSR